MTVRVGVVGCGWWCTAAHLPGIAEHPDATVAAVADPSSDKRAYAAHAFGSNATYETADEMLTAEELEAVVVATPPAHHFEPARAALERGLNVLIEKPMVLSANDARALCRLAEENACELAVGYTWHFSPQVARLRSEIAAGALGEIEHVTSFFGSVARDLYSGNPALLREALGNPTIEPGPDSYADPAIAGGGQVQAQLTHSLALVLHLTGLRATKVAAMVESFELAVDLSDAVSIRFENGAVGALGSSGGMVAGQAEILDCRVLGRKGHALLDVTRGMASIHGGNGCVEALPRLDDAGQAGDGVDNLALYPEKAPVRNLIEMTLGRESNVNPGTLGLHVVEIIEAIYESAREEAVVTLSPAALSPPPKAAAAKP